MAHFAKIENGLVMNVVIVDNAHEANGEAYLNNLGLEGTWIQASYNNTAQGKLASPGDVYVAKKNRFEPPKPYASWKWDEIQYCWVAPIVRPEDAAYGWDEETKSWVAADTIDVGDN